MHGIGGNQFLQLANIPTGTTHQVTDVVSYNFIQVEAPSDTNNAWELVTTEDNSCTTGDHVVLMGQGKSFGMNNVPMTAAVANAAPGFVHFNFFTRKPTQVCGSTDQEAGTDCYLQFQNTAANPATTITLQMSVDCYTAGEFTQ